MTSAVFLGIDIGTSGIRGCCIDADDEEVCSHRIDFDDATSTAQKNEQDPLPWQHKLDQLLCELGSQSRRLDTSIAAIAIDGTSSTLIACDDDGTPLSPALMYNDQQARVQAQRIGRFAPKESAVHGASSSLAKALLLVERYPETRHLCHQADWLNGFLSGNFSISDENNCLKLGYDCENQRWPSWISKNPEGATIDSALLPQVVSPGSAIGQVRTDLISKYQLSENCMMIAGTTDSNAAVLASGARGTADAVTSLGSTLVVKVFSERPVFSPEHGVYSHRLNDRWLVGGASNSGGAVLLQHFRQSELDRMTPLLEPENETGLDYYPLAWTGERFPLNDCHKESKIEPRPDSDVVFFQALLEGIAGIEAMAYRKLEALGANPPTTVYTAGGGNKNQAWTRIRERRLGLNIKKASNPEACFGSALLARQGYMRYNPTLTQTTD